MRIRLSTAIACLVFCAMLVTASAHAAFPGANGRIALAAGCNIVTLDPDGSQVRQLTFEDCPSQNPLRDPHWSPDGTKIAYSNMDDLFVMNADGSGQTNITNSDRDVQEWRPSWSPDGTQIAYERRTLSSEVVGRSQIWIANADGTNQTPLVDSMCGSRVPQWHPDGTRISFAGAVTWLGPGNNDCEPFSPWTIHPDGTGLAPLATEGITSFYDWSPNGSAVTYHKAVAPGNTEIFVQDMDGSPPSMLTNDPRLDQLPHWSPDGTKIVFLRRVDNVDTPHTMDADGSGAVAIAPWQTFDTDWQPIPINAYPRPAGAYPMRASLVPAYEPCVSPNRTHGPPLGFGSCNPPTRQPGQLTVGTPDANGQGAKSLGHLRVITLTGNPATTTDEADVRVLANITDVRMRSDLSDYTGDLEARFTIQITDKNNTPHPGGPGAATVQELTHSHPIPCAETANTTVGSTCQLDTTVEALLPGAVVEKRRAIWELGAIRVHDGAGNLFLTQGLFVP